MKCDAIGQLCKMYGCILQGLNYYQIKTGAGNLIHSSGCWVETVWIIPMDGAGNVPFKLRPIDSWDSNIQNTIQPQDSLKTY